MNIQLNPRTKFLIAFVVGIILAYISYNIQFLPGLTHGAGKILVDALKLIGTVMWIYGLLNLIVLGINLVRKSK
jgi:hypothetical protein